MLTLVAGWEFAEQLFPVAFSDPTKLGYRPQTLAVHLRSRADGTFDPGTALYADLSAGPVGGSAWTALLGFEEDLLYPIPDGAALDYRLGTAAPAVLYYWSGAAWTAVSNLADPAQWSDAPTVRAHLTTFPLVLGDGRLTLQVRFRRGSNGRTGPALRAVRLAAAVAADQLEDLLLDGLVEYFSPVRGTLRWAPSNAGSAAIPTAGNPDLAVYKITGAEAVYDVTADPRATVNKLTGYNPGTGVLTLAAVPPAGHALQARLTYAPGVYHFRSQDLPTAEFNTKVPALLLNELRGLDGTALLPGHGDFVGNAEAKTGIAVPPPRHGAYRGMLYLLTPSERELFILCQRVLDRIDQNPLLRPPGTGERVHIRTALPPVTLARAGITEVHAARLEFQLEHVQLYTRPAEVVPLAAALVPRLARAP